MKANSSFHNLTKQLIEEGRSINVASLEEAIESNNLKTAFITAISIIGGLIGVTMFLIFLGLLFKDLFEDISLTVTLLGLLFLFLSYKVNQSKNQALQKGFAVSLFIIGNTMTTGGIVYLLGGEVFTVLFCGVLFITSIVSLIIYKNELINILSTWCILISIHSFIVIEKAQAFFNFFLVILLLFILWLFAKELSIRTSSKLANRLYLPIFRAVFSYTMIISIMASTEIFSDYYYSTFQVGKYTLLLVLLGSTFYTLKQLMNYLGIKDLTAQIITYSIVGFFYIFVGQQYPAFAVGFLLALWSFKNQDYTGLAIASVTSLWAIGLYYYDLSFNLLTKSIGLFFSGILFLGLYYLFVKKVK